MNTTTPKQAWYADGLKFSCTQCGNCCTGPPGYVWFDGDEAKAMADHLNISPNTLRRRYAHKIDGQWSLNEQKTEHGYDCVFLKRTDEGKALCSIYTVRPTQCRTWPFWPENLQTPSSWRRAAQRCPGIDHGTLYPVDQIRIIRNRNPD